MLVYLDICCLKRPFDDQSQPRIRLESEALLAVLALESPDVRFVSSAALILENRNNHDAVRAARIQAWLDSQTAPVVDTRALEGRIDALIRLGFKNLDAMHVATAEQLRADVLATCDDRFLAAAFRHKSELTVRVIPLLDVVKELA